MRKGNVYDPKMKRWWGAPGLGWVQAQYNAGIFPENCAAGKGLEFHPLGEALKMAEVALRDYTSAERKLAPLWTFMSGYFPDAFMAGARLSKRANDKHNPGEAMRWAREKSKDHLECAARHMLTPDRIDPETGETELVAAFWRIGAELQLREEARLVAAGIRPLSGVTTPV